MNIQTASTSSANWVDAVGTGDAPDELRSWAVGVRSLREAWAICPRGDFLLWLAARLASTAQARREVVLAACDCARTALPYVPADDPRPLRAIEDAERWARGETVDAAEMNAALRAASDEADTEHAVAAREHSHDATAFAAVAAATSVGLAATWSAAGTFAAAVGSAAAAYGAAAGHAAAMATRIAHPETSIAQANARLADLVRARLPTPPG